MFVLEKKKVEIINKKQYIDINKVILCRIFHKNVMPPEDSIATYIYQELLWETQVMFMNYQQM